VGAFWSKREAAGYGCRQIPSITLTSATSISARTLESELGKALRNDRIRRSCPRDFFDPTPDEQNIVLVDAATLRKAERLIESCEHCNPEGTEIPLDNILDRVTGSDPSVTDYILEQPAKCPNCRREIVEKTLAEPA